MVLKIPFTISKTLVITGLNGTDNYSTVGIDTASLHNCQSRVMKVSGELFSDEFV